MKSKTRLDSAAFQLTPTRTRYDLVLTANGKTEKIASGLLNPFLAHLKTAQDQIAKGGYSIILEPDPSSDAAWFTKGTVERFVRFVSNPEVLERVNTIESEILQIGEAIAIQSNDNLGLSTVDVHQKTVDDHQTRSLKSIEGGKPVLDADAGKAIVLYEPGVHPTESNGSTTQEENSKVQLLRVLETRKTVLQKEQGMAFARAVAAGFDMDHMAPLISFAECFGASRLREACLRFMDLWKEKHETGQWLEIEAAEAMSSQSDFSSMETKKWPESNCELGMESNGKASNDTSADKRPPPDTQVPLDHHEYFQGQFQHPIYPHWPIHSPPGAPPVFQAYPMQGIPYYQNYPGNGPFFQPPYPPVEDPRINSVQRMGQKRHSMDSKDSNTELETWEPGVSNTRSQDGSELEKEGSQGREPRRKAGKSSRKNSGMVVIRNINYISSKKQNTSGSESSSGSDPETDEDAEGVGKHKNYMRSSKSEGSHSKPTNTWNTYEKDGMVDEQEVGGGKWQAFQNCLLRNDYQNTRTIERNTFSMEKEGQVMRRKNTTRLDPIVPHGPDWVEGRDCGMTEFDTISGKGGTHLLKASNDELVISGGEFGRGTRDSELDLRHTEIEGQRRGYRRVTNDDFMLYRQENQLGSMSLQSDPLAGEGFESASNNLDRSSSHNVTDESFVVPLRLSSQYQIGTDSRTAIEMDAEFPSGRQKTEDSSSRIRTQLGYEPDDLSLMPERGTQRESIGYDPSLDYETKDTGKVQNRNKEEAMTGVKEGSKRLNKDKKLKGVQDSFEKRKMDAATRKGKPSKLGPSNEAQARAERLRAFKADLQKMKKENEEEGKKRLEALKREREKRIAARGSSGLVQSPLPSQTRPRLPTKLSPSSHKGSKFSDLEPGSSSPLQRLPVRTASVGSNDSQKIIKSSRLNNSSRLAGNGLSRSASSLPELKKEKDGVTPEPKVATTARIRRLSDPKTANRHHVSSPKPKLSDGPENKKISEIMSLDRTKAATLPELKIKTSKGPSVMGQNKSAEKELTQKANGSRSTVVSERTKVKRSNEKTSHDSNGDENPVIEKTVVMLERDTHPIPVVQGSEETMTIKRVSCDDKVGEKTEASKYAEVHAPASTCTMGEICQDSSECQLDERPESCEVTAISARKELPTLLSVGVAEKSYQAPYARVSSLEDPCTTNLEYTKASPPSLKMEAASKETAKAHVSNFTDLNSLEQTPETLEKPRGKESSKGFKRLLKFGKKNNSSAAGERNVESEKLAMNGSLADDQAAGSASYEVHTLKNLISQDETPTSSTSQKASRSFSLLSPFRSKTSEKKQTT